VKFDLAVPFTPVEQLMGVFPADSAHALPKPCRPLLSDEDSAIIDFYPKDVPCDPNGKAMPWLWVVLLPFIEEDRLLEAMGPTREKWSTKEKLQDARGLADGWLFVHGDHPLASAIENVALCSKRGDKGVEKRSLGDSSRWGGFTGTVMAPVPSHQIELAEKIPQPKRSGTAALLKDANPNAALCVAFTEPEKVSPGEQSSIPGWGFDDDI
jgi:5'-3' exoribonuclease 2